MKVPHPAGPGGGEGVDDPDGAEQVGVDRRSGRLEVRGVAQVLKEHDARHGHHGVQLGIPVEHGVTQGLDRRTVGDIRTECAPAFFGEFRERSRTAAGDGHDAARSGEPAGQLSPDARGSADDENGAVGEIHEFFPSVRGATACSPVAHTVRSSVPVEQWCRKPCRTPSDLAVPPSSLVLSGPPLSPRTALRCRYEGRIRQPARQLPPRPA